MAAGCPSGVKFVLNAGGLSPHAAQAALAAAFRARGWHAAIATVSGDSVLERLNELESTGEALAHMDTGAAIASVRERLLFANAYLGARPISDALGQGADIVLTGRVADAALSLGPIMHELGWRWDDWDRLALGLTVGHLLECSGQATGGNFGSAGAWESIPDLLHIGYPIAEVRADGSATITKAPGTGGRVSFDTVRQQLLYEVHNPHAYVSPDVVLDMGGISLDEGGPDRVEVRGAGGAPRPAALKVVAGYDDGWMGSQLVGFSWPDAYRKCEATAEIVRELMRDEGIRYEELSVEYVGYDSLLGAHADASGRDQLNECFLRMSIRTRDRKVAEGFGRLFPWLALSGPPYMGGFHGVERARQLLGIWPTLVRRDLIESRVEVTVEKV